MFYRGFTVSVCDNPLQLIRTVIINSELVIFQVYWKGTDYCASEDAAFEVHFKKARGFCVADAEPFKTHLSISEKGIMNWGIEPITSSTYDKVLAMAMNGEKQQDIAKKLDIHKSNVSRHMQRARMEGKLRSCVT